MHNIRFYEDHVRITILDSSERNHILYELLATGQFEEVVSGINELCLKFDPLRLDEEDVEKIIAAQSCDQIGQNQKSQHHCLPIDFNDSLDMALICDIMDMDETQFQHWFLKQKFKVDMMGFQPGFAYMSHEANAPTISRLDKPRAKVKEGSIGFLGKTACIYAHDGPGGWPIIGRTNMPIFDRAQNPPNLLQSGDSISFGHI